MIGIYDDDYFSGKGFLSLEAMKIASYYASKREFVSLTNDPNPDLFNILYYCKDLGDIKEVPHFSQKNVEYIGHTFWKNDNRLPLQEEILNAEPLFIYRNLDKYIKFPAIPNQIENGFHFRLSGYKLLDDQLKYKIPKMEKPCFFCYNYNITNIYKWFISMRKMGYDWNKCRWFFKFPLQISDNVRLLDTLQPYYVRSNFTFTFNTVLTLEDFYKVVNFNKNHKPKRSYNRQVGLGQKPFIYRPLYDTTQTILENRLEDFMVQALLLRKSNRIFLLKDERVQKGLIDDDLILFYKFLIDYINKNITITKTYGEKEKDLSLRKIIKYRVSSHGVSFEGLRAVRLEQIMNRLIKQRPGLEFLFNASPQEVSYYDWVGN